MTIVSPARPADPGAAQTPIALDDRYRRSDGRALMSGVQAVVRAILEQRRLDEERGLDTAAFVSGYQGSPLGSLDLELARAKKHLKELDIVFHPGLNEELGLTSVAGTQLVERVPGAQKAGVVGHWYGKNPGLDRAADALRHAIMTGTTALGGCVAWIGDDPSSKSSTLPSSCEPMARSMFMPLLAPSTVSEIVSMGLHAVALSRASGLWVGVKIVADIADCSSVVELGGLEIPEPDTSRVLPRHKLLGPAAIEAERDILNVRIPKVLRYAEATGLNRVTHGASNTSIALLAAGTTYAAVLRALAELKIDSEADLDRLGIRLVKIGMPWPFNDADMRSLTAGVEEVLVLEDKLPFLETQLKEAWYDEKIRPLVTGKTVREDTLLPTSGAIGTDEIIAALRARIPALKPATPVRRSLGMLPVVAAGSPKRAPYFCSGCPHNASTRADNDTLVGVGIGCHAMVALEDDRRGNQVGITQMGGEGTLWIGLSPFTTDNHFTANLGDGTFAHSGSLAIRASVAADVNITYKLLWNSAVAMTGGQTPEGRLTVPDLTRMLAAEGVAQMIITTPEPADYDGVVLAPGVTVRHRDDIPDVAAELKLVPGVTVLIHDDQCAAEQRRHRKRGTLPIPAEKIWINSRVCEGCGDCGEVSSCLSVVPVDTLFGRKTTIDQASCNSDFSCIKGDCPSFVVVTNTSAPKGIAGSVTAPSVPDPVVVVGGDALVRMAGIGGTGVVTVSQLLQMAAHVDGRFAAGLEQTGLAQKGGPVISDLRFSASPIDASVKASNSTVDALIAFDMLGATDEYNLATYTPGRTIAIVDRDIAPTSGQITNVWAMPTDRDALVTVLDARTAGTSNAYVDATWVSHRLFADGMPANLILVGAAFQRGVLPITAAAMEQAITLNGTAVANNLAAFQWGRALGHDAAAVRALLSPATVKRDYNLYTQGIPAAVVESASMRANDLVGYQNKRYALDYLAEVRRVAAVEERLAPDAAYPVTSAWAFGLYKLMAYKDEYEVARLHLDAAEEAALAGEFGSGATATVKLHPPMLRAMGLNRKISLGAAQKPSFVALRAMRKLRGTPLDVFGRASLRVTERALIGEYTAVVNRGLARLTPATAGTVAELAGLPDLVRGYESIKEGNIAKFRGRVAEVLAALGA